MGPECGSGNRNVRRGAQESYTSNTTKELDKGLPPRWLWRSRGGDSPEERVLGTGLDHENYSARRVLTVYSEPTYSCPL